MIETFLDDVLVDSYFSLKNSKEYRSDLFDDLKLNYILGFMLTKVKSELNSDATLPSLFVIDSYRRHNALPHIRQQAYDFVSDHWSEQPNKLKAKFLTDAQETLVDTNKVLGSIFTELSHDYYDMGHGIIVYKLIETQLELDRGKPLHQN